MLRTSSGKEQQQDVNGEAAADVVCYFIKGRCCLVAIGSSVLLFVCDTSAIGQYYQQLQHHFATIANHLDRLQYIQLEHNDRNHSKLGRSYLRNHQHLLTRLFERNIHTINMAHKLFCHIFSWNHSGPRQYRKLETGCHVAERPSDRDGPRWAVQPVNRVECG